MKTTHGNRECVGFHMIITHLEFDILTKSPTLDSTTISDEDFKIRNREGKEMDIISNPVMNKIMRAATINQYHHRPMFDVALDIQCLQGQNTLECMKSYDEFV